MNDEKSVASLLEELLEETQKTYEYKVKAKILNKEEGNALRNTISELERYQKVLKLEGIVDNNTAFERVRGLFAEENMSYQNQVDAAGKKLEYGFDFMEIAFGNTQEMISFITELNTNFYSVQFLQNYECERYYQYNKNLLFDQKRADILNRIEHL